MLRASGIHVRFDGVTAVEDATISVPEGETLAVLGPSGCGKSTLLRVIAGLQRAEAGSVELDGHDVRDVPAHRRGVGLMFQDDVLFPHRDVAGNVAFGLRMANRRRPEIERRVEELLDLVGLSGFQRRSVTSLSGGERERVALARALAPEPRVLLLDEPLGSLDRPLHDRLLAELEELFTRIGITVVAVTHDVTDAFALGHRVAVMRAGRVVQAATPDRLWARPADAWVARFLGHANVEEREGQAVVTRPEAVRLTIAREGGATVVSAERRGPLVRLRARLDGGEELEAVTTAIDHPAAGDRVSVEIDPSGVVTVPNGVGTAGD
jgi:thiamine transport system ATP-binding protein